jgi:hypothetical protein
MESATPRSGAALIAELNDLLALSWETRAPLPTPLTQGAGAVVGGKFYVMNAAGPAGISAPRVYDPVTDSWSTGAPDGLGRSTVNAGVINDKIYVAEGWTNSDSNNPTGSYSSYH